MMSNLSKSFHEYGRNDHIAGTIIGFGRRSNKDALDLATKKEHEALIRQKRQERIAKEQEKKISEWRMAIEREAAQRRQAEIERERRIREMKEREAQRRRQFEERRKALQEQETERRKKIMAKYTSSTSSINSSNCGGVNQKSTLKTTPHIISSPQKRQTATAPVYAFGSSTPRTLSYLEKLKSDMKAYDARLKTAPSAISSTTNDADHSQRVSSSLSHHGRQVTSARNNTPQRYISYANLNGRKSEAATAGRMASSMYVPRSLNSPPKTVQPVIKKPPSRSSQSSARSKENVRPITTVVNNRMTRSFAAMPPTGSNHATAELSRDSRQETPRSVKRKPVERIIKVDQEEFDAKSLDYLPRNQIIDTISRFSPAINEKSMNEIPEIGILVLSPDSDQLKTSFADDQEKLRIEEAEKRRLLQEELDIKRKKQEESDALEALRLAEEKRLKETIEEEERAKKEAEEKLREEEARKKKIEAETRLREQQERLDRERKEVEERARREEEERLERKKKLDAIMQRTRNVKSTAPSSSSVNSASTTAAATLLQSPDTHLPPTTFSSSGSPSAASENATSTSSYAPTSPSSTTTNNMQSPQQIHSSSSAALLQKYANSNSEIGRSVENILAKVRSNSALNRNLANGNHSINSTSVAGGDSNANLSLQSSNLSKTNLLVNQINDSMYDSLKKVNSTNHIEAGGDQSNDSKSQYDIDAKSDASRSYFALLLQNRNSGGGDY